MTLAPSPAVFLSWYCDTFALRNPGRVCVHFFLPLFSISAQSTRNRSRRFRTNQRAAPLPLDLSTTPVNSFSAACTAKGANSRPQSNVARRKTSVSGRYAAQLGHEIWQKPHHSLSSCPGIKVGAPLLPPIAASSGNSSTPARRPGISKMPRFTEDERSPPLYGPMALLI